MDERAMMLANLREAMRGELAAINEYERFASEAGSPAIRDLFLHIGNEEKHHVVEEFQAILALDPEQAQAFQEVFRVRPGNPAPRTFTRQELARFDGQGGRPAYVAIEGSVYDVTNVRGWGGGAHHGHLAGEDLTIGFRSRHDLSLLQRLPKVGTLVQE